MGVVGIERLPALAKQFPIEIKPSSFYFLRHGQTPRNVLKIFQSYQEPLSEVGEEQALAAAAALAKLPLPPRTIFCSDATRTMQTAEPCAKTLDVTPTFTPLLKERHFGDLVGTSSASIDWDCKPAGGETLDQFVERTRNGLDLALNNGHDDPVLIVAHGGNLFVLAYLLNIPLDYKLFGNALPLYVSRAEDGKWTAEPLLAASTDGPNLA